MRKEKQTRFCDYCGKPIPLDSRSSRKYCPREVMRDGSIKNCKDDFHNCNKLQDYYKTKDLMRLYLEYENILSASYDVGIYEVELEVLNLLNIDLSHFQKIRIANSSNQGFKMLNILLEQIDTDQFKIHKLNDDGTTTLKQ